MNVCRVLFVVLFALVGFQSMAEGEAGAEEITLDQIDSAIVRCQQQASTYDVKCKSTVGGDCSPSEMDQFRSDYRFGCKMGVELLAIETASSGKSMHEEDTSAAVFQQLGVSDGGEIWGIRGGIQALRVMDKFE